MAGATVVKHCNFSIDGNKIVPKPKKYQQGVVRFSWKPDNRIQGLEKLDNLKVR